LPILKEYPEVRVDIKWELQDSDEKDIVCVIIPAKLHGVKKNNVGVKQV
jgi:hypothetical protein